MDPMQRWTLETSYRAFENGRISKTNNESKSSTDRSF